MNLDIFEILNKANANGASDIHISTQEKPVFRINGTMETQEDLPILTLEESKKLIEQTMSEEEKTVFAQERDLDYAIEIPSVARFRVNAFLTTKGFNAVFRIIPSKITTFDELKLPEILRNIIDLRKGLVIVTGPTGSGKSTTLAAIIDLINKTRKAHIVTIEDPIEFVHQPQQSIITHREVGKHTKTFASALRVVTREDPDVVLVGEMRDLETISLALTAAESGALVFGTLHTSSAAKTITRIVDVFSAEEQDQIRSMLADSVQFIIAQALLKKVGGGRTGVFEILIGTDAVRNQIRKNEVHQIPLSIQSGRDVGMQSIDQHLFELLRNKEVPYEEAIVHAVHKPGFDQFKPLQ